MMHSVKWQSVTGVLYSAISKKSEHLNYNAIESLKDSRALSPWNRGRLEKLVIPQAVKKLSGFYGSRKFNIVFKKLVT
jgi:hypothetical protein